MTASAWGREDSVTASGDRVSFGADGNILELVVIIARLGEYTKNRGTVHFKRVCELHLWYVNYISIKNISELSKYNSI